MLVIADADALVAFANPEDRHHIRVKMLIRKFVEQKVQGLFPVTAVCETVTVLQRKLNRPDLALFVVEKVNAGVFPLQTVDPGIVKAAFELFKPRPYSGDTLFDAIVAAIAIQNKAVAIFSFDHWYKDIGLELAEDYFFKNR